jgi:hyperosmotically inducible periplasmic protein
MKMIQLILCVIFLATLSACSNTVISDADLIATVKAKLAIDPDVSAIKIGVSANNGVVTLSGVVPKQKEKDQAERVAKGVEGVASVVNTITIDPNSLGASNVGEKAEEALRKTGQAIGEVARDTARDAGSALGDAAVVAKIKTKLVADGITGTNVDVSKGEATLKGEVANEQQRAKAEAIARRTEGVKSVVNLLTVRKG